MILGFAVSNKLSFQVVKEAIQNAIKTINLLPGEKESYSVADGGSENNNMNISLFLSKLGDIKLTQLTALKDIIFSNSPVEAIHRIMKGRYLRTRKFESIEKLQTFLEWAVEDYNFVRPHYKHSPKTPGEMYFGTKLKFDPLKRLKKASAKRLKNNKSTSCAKCSVLVPAPKPAIGLV
jgi:putative transposase